MIPKNWNRLVIGLTVLMLALITVFQIVVDPFFHFHGELPGLEYPLNDERFQNDGLQRHRDYEILVTGTSMSQNFNPSRIEELWGKKAIKTCYSGATFYELRRGMQNAIRHNPDLTTIICSFDLNSIVSEPDVYSYEGIPDYLYDNNPFNDVKYIFNKDVLTKSIAVLNYTRSGKKTPSMDMYGRFDTYMPTGFEAVTNSYERLEEADLSVPFTDETKEIVYNNVVANFVEIAKKNPDIKFVFFVPPYSFCYWDAMVRTNQLSYSMSVLKYAIELLLAEDNIEVYSFYQWEDVLKNLDYYSDTIHFNGEICDRIVESIYNEDCRLSADSIDEYFADIEAMFNEMDYSSLD